MVRPAPAVRVRPAAEVREGSGGGVRDLDRLGDIQRNYLLPADMRDRDAKIPAEELRWLIDQVRSGTEDVQLGDLVPAYADLVQLYHEAYAAHHGDQGPGGCPLCAEFRPRFDAAIDRVDRWLASIAGEAA